MKRILLVMLLGIIAVSGCFHPYVIKLNNDMQVTAPRKPTLKDGAYQYKGPDGQIISIPAGRVREIEPASMAKSEEPHFQQQISTKKRHWYLLWLD